MNLLPRDESLGLVFIEILEQFNQEILIKIAQFKGISESIIVEVMSSSRRNINLIVDQELNKVV